MRTAWALLLLSCTEAFIQRPPKEEERVDDRLAITGRVCTDRPDPSAFPVKVIFVVDQSGSMCVSDPPGSQGSEGFCQNVANRLNISQETPPARVRALTRLLETFADKPNVEVALVPFETSVRAGTEYPATGFVRASDKTMVDKVKDLQSGIGKGTDYQGALAYAYARIHSDVTKVMRSNPAALPRTRYVVVFLTDGVPFPKCSANDQLNVYADDLNPDQLWADSFAVAGPDGFCNQLDPDERRAQFGIDDNTSTNIAGYAGGTDRNQNYQLQAYVDQLMELKQQYNIGDVRLHTVLLFNEQAVRACGDICQDIYGEYVRWPGPMRVDDGAAAAHRIAEWTLRMLADRGNGTFQEFRDFAGIARLDLGGLDYTSLRSRNVMKSFFVQPLSSVPTLRGRTEDSDGDGLPDELDNDKKGTSSPFDRDSDDDGFSDLFEVEHHADGFRANAKDARGCDPLNPATPNCRPSDVDGDGLSDFHERFTSTFLSDTTLIDADGDGLPNGLEVQLGLDPLQYQGQLDTDGDGVSDVDEVRLSSDPLTRDPAYREDRGVTFDLTATTRADDSVCYDFSVGNLSLVTPALRAGQSRQGFNLFKVWFAEAPEDASAQDYGVWKAACVWAQYDPPSVRVPAGPSGAPLVPSNFFVPAELVTDAHYDSRCLGINPSRGQPAP